VNPQKFLSEQFTVQWRGNKKQQKDGISFPLDKLG
jgi:hypothetical protein